MTIHLPQIGDIVAIHLPHETMRAAVIKTFEDDNDTIVVQLSVMAPFSRNHDYHLDDIVTCKRERLALGERWEAIHLGEPKPKRKRTGPEPEDPDTFEEVPAFLQPRIKAAS